MTVQPTGNLPIRFPGSDFLLQHQDEPLSRGYTRLAQRYLLHSPHPQPVVWADVVAELKHVRPDVNWTEPMVQGRVLGVRKRLRAVGVEGLHSDEVEPPIGNALNHNLIIALLAKAVLTPQDLRLLDDAG